MIWSRQSHLVNSLFACLYIEQLLPHLLDLRLLILYDLLLLLYLQMTPLDETQLLSHLLYHRLRVHQPWCQMLRCL